MSNFNEMEDLVQKWESTGLLTDINDLSEKIQLSNTLEEIADNLMHSNDESDAFQTKAVIMLPLARRVFSAGARDIEYDKLSNVIDELFPLLEGLEKEAYNNIDAEAEFTCMCEEKYLKDIGRNL